MKPYLTCLTCREFYYVGGTPAYSEVTPEVPTYMDCMKSHWRWDSYDDSKAEFVKKILMGNSCCDYKEESE